MIKAVNMKLNGKTLGYPHTFNHEISLSSCEKEAIPDYSIPHMIYDPSDAGTFITRGFLRNLEPYGSVMLSLTDFPLEGQNTIIEANIGLKLIEVKMSPEHNRANFCVHGYEKGLSYSNIIGDGVL